MEWKSRAMNPAKQMNQAAIHYAAVACQQRLQMRLRAIPRPRVVQAAFASFATVAARF